MDATSNECRAVGNAHQRLLSIVGEMSDDTAAQPSLLPGWTIGHVLTHLARNAEGQRRMVDAAAEGRVGEMYPAGAAGRTADIDHGATRPAAAIVDDLADQCTELERAWDRLDTAGWAGHGTLLSGRRPITDLPALRRREVEVHLVDLGLGPTWEHWPADFVRHDLRAMTMLWAARRPMGLTTIPEAARRAGDHHQLAWLLGRAEIEGLGPAGVYA